MKNIDTETIIVINSIFIVIDIMSSSSFLLSFEFFVHGCKSPNPFYKATERPLICEKSLWRRNVKKVLHSRMVMITDLCLIGSVHMYIPDSFTFALGNEK